jgi:sec-independent protein translocase protein TatA
LLLVRYGERGNAPKENVMGGLSIWHILIIVVIVLLLFGGRGKISDIMGDFAKGINSFRKGLNEHDDDTPPRSIPQDRADDANANTTNKDQTVGR